jgi:fluoride exporter
VARLIILRDAPVVAVVAAGGVVGALARYGLGVAFPHPRGGFPWATFGVNVSGCLLIGALIVLVTEGFAAHPLARPFLGTGILGGYTTFSTAMVDTQRLWSAGAAGTGLAYLFGTLAAALAAVYLGVLGTRWSVSRRRAA